MDKVGFGRDSSRSIHPVVANRLIAAIWLFPRRSERYTEKDGDFRRLALWDNLDFFAQSISASRLDVAGRAAGSASIPIVPARNVG